jgi:hypothetical protein
MLRSGVGRELKGWVVVVVVIGLMEVAVLCW